MMKNGTKGAAVLSCMFLVGLIGGFVLFSGMSAPAEERECHTDYIMDIRNVYQDLLHGKAQFFYVSGEHAPKCTDIGSVPAIFSPSSEYAAIWQFALVDLEGDGEQELVLQVTDVAGDMGGYLVLHRQEGKVYGYASHYRMFGSLKTDGTFYYANLALTEQGIGTASHFSETGFQMEPFVKELTNDGWTTAEYFKGSERISEENYRQEQKRQEQKPDAVWYEFTEDGIAQAFEVLQGVRIDSPWKTETAQDTMADLRIFLEEANAGTLRDSFSVKVSDGQELLVKLYEKQEQPTQGKADAKSEQPAQGKVDAKSEQPAQQKDEYFEVGKIRIYRGKQWIQTIDPATLPPVEEYAWDGLYVNQGYTVGEPDVRDLNFDGAQDFGLLAVEAYPKNVPYSYFLWNQKKQQFDYGFTLFGSEMLVVDEKNRRLVEHSYDVSGEYLDFYSYTADGRILRRE